MAPPPRTPRGIAPPWAHADGYEVHQVSQATKVYECPGCYQAVTTVPHLVVIPNDDVQQRRHWHTPCWRRELVRLGLLR